jgi:hypothetical protein
MAKSLKGDDAKLKGLKSNDNASQLPNTSSVRSKSNGGFIMKMWHKFFVGYYSVLMQDCLDEGLKAELSNKLNYHETKLNIIN